MEAVEFSKMVSEQGPIGLPNDKLTFEQFSRMTLGEILEPTSDDKNCSAEGLCSDGVTGGCKSKCSIDVEDYKNILCYSCSYVISNVKEIPFQLKESLQKIQRQKVMRNEIKDFLL